MATHPTIRKGSKGDAVKQAQESLKLRFYDPGKIDGLFGAKTESAVKWYQSDHGLAADGIVGTRTWAGLDPPLIKRGSTGDAVKMAQRLLAELDYEIGTIDGDFGERTERAVRAFQSDFGLDADGIVGPQTWAMLGS